MSSVVCDTWHEGGLFGSTTTEKSIYCYCLIAVFWCIWVSVSCHLLDFVCKFLLRFFVALFHVLKLMCGRSFLPNLSSSFVLSFLKLLWSCWGLELYLVDTQWSCLTFVLLTIRILRRCVTTVWRKISTHSFHQSWQYWRTWSFGIWYICDVSSWVFPEDSIPG